MIQETVCACIIAGVLFGFVRMLVEECMQLTPRQELRKTELQRQLINLRRKARGSWLKQLFNKARRLQTKIDEVERELLAIDPHAVTYTKLKAY